jgi:ferredoxin
VPRPKRAATVKDIRTLAASWQQRAEHRTVDLGPFGGVETFVGHDDIIVSREDLVDICKQAQRTVSKKAYQHALEALRDAARLPCKKSNCGSVCLCMSCHARAALEEIDPQWRP